MKKKLIVDILMFILLIPEFSRVYTCTIVHEIIGITLFVLMIIHLLLNKKYLINIFKIKHNTKTIIILITNIILVISFLLTTIFGIMSSKEILTFLSVHNLNIIKLHKIFGYISLIIVGLHLGINFNSMFGRITKLINNDIVNCILGISIVILGIYSFIKVDYLKHLTGEYGFSINIGSLIISILEYLSIIMMIVIIANFIYKKIGGKSER